MGCFGSYSADPLGFFKLLLDGEAGEDATMGEMTSLDSICKADNVACGDPTDATVGDSAAETFFLTIFFVDLALLPLPVDGVAFAEATLPLTLVLGDAVELPNATFVAVVTVFFFVVVPAGELVGTLFLTRPPVLLDADALAAA